MAEMPVEPQVAKMLFAGQALTIFITLTLTAKHEDLFEP